MTHFHSRSSSYNQYNGKYDHRVRYLFHLQSDMQLCLQRFLVCNIHIEKQNCWQMFDKVAFPFLIVLQPWPLWMFYRRTFIISKLPPFPLLIKFLNHFWVTWARGTRHEETALLPVSLPVLSISITEHAPHPPSSHICLTSVWPCCRRFESKVSFKLTSGTSYLSLLTVNLFKFSDNVFLPFHHHQKLKLVCHVRQTRRPN